MFVLTKFAMLFFLFALAALVMAYGNRQRDSICSDEANRVAGSIASTIAYVINSPVEDERKIYPLEPSLSVGREDFERYVINVTHLNSTRILRIEVKPLAYAASCHGEAHATYPENMSVDVRSAFEATFRPPRTLGVAESEYVINPDKNLEVVSMFPGGHPRDFRTRSAYVIVLKCTDKRGIEFPPRQYLFMQNCGNRDPAACLNYNDLIGLQPDCCINAEGGRC